MFSLGPIVFICFFRQRAAVVFHSLKAREFLCGDDGGGIEAFVVNNVEIITFRLFSVCSSFSLPFHLLFRCVWKTIDMFLVEFLCSHALILQINTYSRIQ